MKNLWFQHGDMLLAVEEAHMGVKTKKHNLTIETNDTDKYNRASSAAIDMENGDIIWTGSIVISDSPFGRIIKPTEWYEIESA